VLALPPPLPSRPPRMPNATSYSADPARSLLRHAVATLAYRGGKVLDGAPPTFADLRVAEGTRTPAEILTHIGDLLDWALSMARGAQAWRDSVPLAWDAEVERFFAALARFDAFLALDAPLGVSLERLFQGPVADALTHVGQLGMLRRLGGAPVRGENYARADIVAGRVGRAQTPPRREFE
jgi:hypothetical protein